MLPLIIKTCDFKLTDLALKNNVPLYNIVEIKPLKEEITIGQIRDLKKDLIVFQKEKRMIVFYDFDKSGLEAQNSLLKILEEKVERNLFVFLVENDEKVIQTIKSRAKVVVKQRKNNIEEVDLVIAAIIEQIEKSKNLSFLNNKKLLITKKEQFLEIVNQLVIYFRKKLIKDGQDKLVIAKVLKKIFNITSLVENNNLNPQLSLDNLLIFIWKSYSMRLNS